MLLTWDVWAGELDKGRASAPALNRNPGWDEAVRKNSSRCAGARGGARVGKPSCGIEIRQPATTPTHNIVTTWQRVFCAGLFIARRYPGWYDPRSPPVMDYSRVRLVDYKVSMRRSFRADEWDLVTKTLQGRQLQPPL